MHTSIPWVTASIREIVGREPTNSEMAFATLAARVKTLQTNPTPMNALAVSEAASAYERARNSEAR